MSGFRIFDLKARDYDRWYDRHRITYLNELKLVRSFGCARALEIGVGTGRFAADTGVVVGVDPSLSMLRMAPSRVQ
ncbi:MAG TPA: methyltransferase type 11, partial [Nitrososphaeria archaeon]|nr:methyltransferase type 11 [Nitrososphaeria archaeon]